MSPEQFRVLLVAADLALRQTLRDSLNSAGFAIEESSDPDEAIRAISQNHHDLVLLDLNLPSSAAVMTCRRLRELSPRIGIVMVHDGGRLEDEAQALEVGADDCMAAPFRFRELVARIAAVLRRASHDPAKTETVLRAGDIEVDLRHRICWHSGKKLHLSPKEFDLLVFFMKNQNVPLPRLKLLRSIWGPSSPSAASYLRSYVKTLRKKIEKDPSNPEYIRTVPWVGYLFHNSNGPQSEAPERDF